MIEYYTFKHRGYSLEYRDEVFLRLVPSITVALFDGNKLESAPKSQSLLFSEILSSEEGRKNLTDLNDIFEECLDEKSEYFILRVVNNGIECIRKGGVCAKIVSKGQITLLPNGFYCLDSDDRVICATDNFFKHISEEGILADALVADSCSEWMNMLVRRISDQTQLKCGNLSAVTLKLCK